MDRGEKKGRRCYYVAAVGLSCVAPTPAVASHRRTTSGSAGTRRFDDIALLYPASDMVERTFQQDELRLHVRRFDPHNLYDAQGGGLDRVELVPLTIKLGTEAGETR